MDLLVKTARDLLQLNLTVAQVAAFRRYASALLDWNTRVNLTAITDEASVEIRHFIDSLACLLVMRPLAPGARIVDVGTGAGFPGLPLKIAFPSLHLTLVEATGKKVRFLEHLVSELNLSNVTLINERAETVGHLFDHRERYDWVLARAVAGMPVLAEYLLPLCKVGGACIAQKGETAHQEASDAQEAIHVLGGRLTGIRAIELPGVAETHYLVEIAKIAATPPQYPRRVGAPSKRPLGV